MRQRGKSPPTKNQPQNFIPEPLIRQFMPELDTLRGIAVLTVVFFHGFARQYETLPFQGVARLWLSVTGPGWLGVNLFFVLSGFLITGILLESRHKPRYYSRFYTRRALRILPAYYSLLILLAVLHESSSAFLGLSFVYLSNHGRLVWHLDGIRATLVAVSRGALLHTLANRSAQSPHSIFGRNPGFDMHPCPNRAGDIVS
jgi:hypothetical protein